MHRPPRIFAAILALIAVALLYGGLRLLAVGGSVYYLLSGAAVLASAILLWRGSRLAAKIYGGLLLATLAWSLLEVGADLWALMPRLAFLAVIGAWFLTPYVRRGLYSPQPPPPLLGSARSRSGAAASAVAVIAVFIVGSRNTAAELSPRNVVSRGSAQQNAAAGEWHHYGNTTHGTRYARLDQINAANVAGLKELWHYRTGHSGQFKATPLQIGDLLYVCTAMNVIVALDAESGIKRWEFDPQLTVAPVGFNVTCRGVSYYRAPAEYSGDCPARIIMGTTDARLMAVNALTGERCRDFGNNVEISLLKGIGEAKPNIYLVTTPPLIARNLAVVGTRVADNFEVDEPSGVVRAYDAVTGKFA